MILEVLKENFDEIFVFDTEFIRDIDERGDNPNVICAVYKGLKSQKFLSILERI